MADFVGSGYMGDATGGIGQGLAFVLPEGKAATYAMQLAQTHASQLQQIAKAKVAMQQKAQLQYENDFKNQDLPKAFAPFDEQLNKRHNKWLEDAAKSYAETGKNPFNDPNFVTRHNDEVLIPARKSLELGQNYTKLRAIAETDPTNKYTKESKQAVIDYEQKIKDDPFGALDKPLPKLIETPATADDFVKALKPEASGDISHNKAQVFSQAMGDPKWHDMLKQYGYNPDLPDFGVYNDKGKRVWFTNPTFTGHQADLILDNPTIPRNKQVLDKLGIDPNDPWARESLRAAIKDQNAAMGKFVTENANRITDPAKVEQLKREEHSQWVADQHLAIDWARLSMEKKKQLGDNIVLKIFEGSGGGSLEGLNAISKMYEMHGSYKAGLKDLQDDGETVSFTIPGKLIKNPYYVAGSTNKYSKDAYTRDKDIPVVLHRSEPISFKAGIYEALKNVGSPTQISKFVEGKGIQDKKQPAKLKAGALDNL